MYTTEELVKVADKVFGFGGALVEAALRKTERERFTIEEAKRIVWDFANKTVEKQ